MTDKDFEEMRTNQYCDNKLCTSYQKVGSNNIRIQSRKNKQLYCNVCGNKFSVRRGTMFYGLHTPADKIINCLSLLASGMGVNSVVRETGVTGDSLRAWTDLASSQVGFYSTYMQRNMSLGQVQIDEFWSYIRKKKKK